MATSGVPQRLGDLRGTRLGQRERDLLLAAPTFQPTTERERAEWTSAKRILQMLGGKELG